VNHDQIAIGVFDGEDLERYAGGIVSKNEDAIGLGRVVGRRLAERQPAMLNDVADPGIADAMFARCIKNPGRQLATP
jgi:hypothetical protein